MKIIKLSAENIKRLKAIEISPDSNLVVIGGKNAQGKTSVLDSISYALAGASTHPDKPIRDGQDKARIVCELDDLIVTRTFTPSGGTLVVSNKEGVKFPSPQTMLDKLTGKLTFDPLAFARMQPSEQFETLKSLVGLDFAEIDARRKQLYEERTIVNHEGKKLASQVKDMPEYPDVQQEVSVAQLMEELSRGEELNRLNKVKRDNFNSLINSVKEQELLVDQLKTELDTAKSKLVELQLLHQNQQSEVFADVDTDKVRERFFDAETINQKVRSNREIASLKRILDEKRAESMNLRSQIQEIEDAKAKALSEVVFPVVGLSFGESHITYNGIPFSQCSVSEQLRVSLAMGLAMNPKLKVVLIREGSLLDEDNLKMVAEMAAVADAQVWLEKVGEGDDVSIIIEDGMIKA